MFKKKLLSIIIAVSLTLIILSFTKMTFSDNNIKNPNVAGAFYPSNKEQLSSDITKYLNNAQISPYTRHIDIVISPHAGYFYSGAVAAYGYKAVSKNKYNTIVIMGPSHYYPFNGISIWEQGAFKTPLGMVNVDSDFASKIISSGKKFYYEPKAFDKEHSVEVQIPFLQKIFSNFKIVPIVIGNTNAETLKGLASTLNLIIGDRKDVLIIVSSDMSHYYTDVVARRMDKDCIDDIKVLNIEKYWKDIHNRKIEMCGFMPATVGMLYAQIRGLKHVDVLKYANSGDTSGDKDRVVGYTSIVIYGDKKDDKVNTDTKLDRIAPLTREEQKELINIAKNTVEEYVKNGNVLKVSNADPRLEAEEGAFVTLKEHNSLRGCIGNILGKGPLYLTVRDMAIAAASEDPRFHPVDKKELKNIDIEVSVLSKPKVIKDVSEIKLGVHGVIVSRGFLNRGIFLPQVADETGWTKEEFLSELCSQKAHLPRDAWKDPKTKIEIFTADVFSEDDFK